MSKIFLTKVWGFSPETYPALGFNGEGGRNKYLREAQPGDWVLLAGTKGHPTNPDDQGRLLGKIQLGTDLIDVEAVLKSVGTPIPQSHYNDDGSYKWPFGLPMLQAYRFVDSPDLKQLFGSYLNGMQWASYALNIEEKLGHTYLEQINSLRIEEATIVDAPEISRQRERNTSLILNRSQTGPPPSSSRAGSESSQNGSSSYILQLHQNNNPLKIFKVGFSSNLGGRLSNLNKGLVTAITEYKWKLVLEQKFSTAKLAYKFEQLMHEKSSIHRVPGEMEIYETEFNVLRSIWANLLYDGDWAIIN